MDLLTAQNKAEREWDSLEHPTHPVVQIGMGTCGRAAGAGETLGAIRRSLERIAPSSRVVTVGCVGMCHLEPLMAVRRPGGPTVFYGRVTPRRAEAILAATILNGDPRADWAACYLGDDPVDGVPYLWDLPMMKPQVRIALRNCGFIDPERIDHYIARGGYQGLHRALRMQPEQVIQEIRESGLRGRGGAGFPTAVKWELARQAQGTRKYVICNGDEGDPGAFMDRSLLEGDPHAVLEGLVIAGYAIGAERSSVYVRAAFPLAVQRVKTALAQMREFGFVGRDIMGTGFDFDIRVHEGAGAFVCGEETGLIASLRGRRASPRPRPPFPVQAGVSDQPTSINNVETLADVSAIMQRGAAWFAGYGTEKSRGTKTFSLAGNVTRTGLIEVPLGITLGEIVYGMGGGAPGGREVKAVQTGGPAGGCIPMTMPDLSVDYESLSQAGSIIGSGGMVVMDEDTCMVDVARYFLSFTQSESCGKCLPCRLGTRSMLDTLEDICAGRGRPDDLKILNGLSEAVQKASLCGLGRAAPNPVQAALRYFPHEFEAHISRHECPAGVCRMAPDDRAGKAARGNDGGAGPEPAAAGGGTGGGQWTR